MPFFSWVKKKKNTKQKVHNAHVNPAIHIKRRVLSIFTLSYREEWGRHYLDIFQK